MTHVQQLDRDLFLIDTQYNRTPEAIGVFLLVGDRPALIETGPASCAETVLEGIRHVGLRPEDLQAIAVTHIHLDHAGATGTIVGWLPHLEVYVHPAGAPHLVDPSRLMASAGRLYGDDLKMLFGDVVPLPAGRVRTLGDGARVELGSRRLVALDTPGHAGHHLVYLDEDRGDAFTGDAAGIAVPGSYYVYPPTPPPELDVPLWEATIDRLRTMRPRRLLLTHFGAHTWADELLAQLKGRLVASADLVRQALNQGLDDEAVVAMLQARTLKEITEVGGPDLARRLEIIMATRMTALGLIRFARKRG